MSMHAIIRIKKEYREVRESSDGSGVSADLVDDSFSHWKGRLIGPSGTPYAGGTFIVDIQIPQNYPFEPPKMRFDTKVWHPNVSSQNGAICLDILKKEWYEDARRDAVAHTRRRYWTSTHSHAHLCSSPSFRSPALTLRTALLSLQALLSCPNPDDPQDAVVAGQYKKDRAEFEATAKFWTTCYAGGTDAAAIAEKVKRLTEMGFGEAACKVALEKCKNDENAAVEYLMTHA